MKFLLICTALLLPYSLAIPVPLHEGPSTGDLKFAEVYLDRFFPSLNETSDRSLEERLRQMQKYFHLNVTGKMDEETINVMKQPRCGVPDVLEFRKGPRKWGKNVLTYRINNFTPDMSRPRVIQAIAKAFRVWSNVTPLRFQRTEKPADIEIWFRYGRHGDECPFYGKGGKLAYAYFPGTGIGGDAHFDDAEKWSEYNRDVNLFLVAAHEFGHSLGLDHTNVRGALMYPTYSYRNPDKFSLPANDVYRIQRLYGKRR